MIKVITFDLWDTVFIDDSDEPKRKAAGRLSKHDERRQLVFDYANRQKEVSKELVDIIYNTVDAAFRKVWQEQFITWEVKDRLEIIFKGLDVEIPADEMAEIVRLHEEMELEFKPDFIEGVGDAIQELHKDYSNKNISIVSLSIDKASHKDKWLQMVADEELTGIQIMADNDDFAAAYNISGIPRFILIDPEGNIVDSNAPRPSDPKLRQLFESLNL